MPDSREAFAGRQFEDGKKGIAPLVESVGFPRSSAAVAIWLEMLV
jgi:hypothetical protein